MPPSVGTETAIIVDSACARSRRCAIESIAAFGTAYETLHYARCNGPTRRVRLVGLEPFLRQRKNLFADDRRYGDRNPILSRSLMVGAITRRDAAVHSYRSRNPLTRCNRCLAKTSLPLIGRIAQHAPNHRTFPTPALFGRGDVLFIQVAGNSADAETIRTVKFEYPPHNLRLLFIDLIVRRRLICFADKQIPERGAAQHADFTLASAMSFATARALQNLCAFVLCDHALKL